MHGPVAGGRLPALRADAVDSQGGSTRETRVTHKSSLYDRAAEATANGLQALTARVASHDQTVADVTEKVTRGTGAVLDGTGQVVASAGQQVARHAFQHTRAYGDSVRDLVQGGSTSRMRRFAGGLAGALTRLGTGAAGVAAGAVSVAGAVVAAAGRGVESCAPAVGGTVGGLTKGVAQTASHTVDAALLPASRIEAMRQELMALGGKLQYRSREELVGQRRDRLLEGLVVAGVTLAYLVRHPAQVPPQVQQAFELAYPGLHAGGETFAEAAARMSSEELVGLVAGVKGKLFELQLVEQLNNGQLPDGWQAEIAGSATQPGWDIRILDAGGGVQEVLQAKATESARYVAEALQRYPEIDVSTTAEVHAQLTAMGMAESVHNSGISEASLEAAVNEAAQSGDTFSVGDLLPSVLALGAVALTVFMRQDLNLREKGQQVGERGARLGMAGAVGNMAALVSNLWWVGLVAVVGSNWLAHVGGDKRERYDMLRSAIQALRAVAGRRVPIEVPALALAGPTGSR